MTQPKAILSSVAKTVVPALFAPILFLPLELHAQKDGMKHWGADVEYVSGKAIVMDEYQKKWMKGKDNHTIGIRANYTPLPCDSDSFAAEYDYPTLSIGLRYSINNGITMHRSTDRYWPLIIPVDYDSKLGNIITLYGKFSRPLPLFKMGIGLLACCRSRLQQKQVQHIQRHRQRTYRFKMAHIFRSRTKHHISFHSTMGNKSRLGVLSP